MQRQQSRKREYSRTNQLSKRLKAFTGIQLISLVLFTSCSTVQTNKYNLDLSKPKASLYKSFSMSCLKGEGRATLTNRDKSDSFNFETNLTDKFWILGVSIPLMGQEVIKVNYTPYKVSGGLYEILNKEFKKRNVSEARINYSKKAIKQVAVSFRKIQNILSNPKKCNGKRDGDTIIGTCGKKVSYTLKKDALQFFYSQNGIPVTIDFTLPSEKIFRTTNISIWGPKGAQVKLQFSECY